ncbi:L2 [Zalophus californianus papillomavirus 1]|uniref:Minor capsid protein L2 n=1 Tax=Zalophus californianus papillomavirus 1 TaxID=998829 RepID=F2X1C7_9PAPI|nr:L2 [Zalophus californianus papillomavirus 1]ADZ74265.1 L2 [Zalophus californianus papillomavirus 1]
MARARRTKRANPTDLYKTCKAAGTCPPDVIPRVEGSTVADKILQIGGSAVFFGGLGIGTGAGRGGRIPYTPLGGRTGPAPARPGAVGPGGRGVRPPPVIIDTLGPGPVEAVRPTDPSIVPLVEASGDVTVDVVEVAAEVPTGIPRVPPGGSGGAPVVTSDASSVAVLELAPEPAVTARTSVSRSQFSNPAFEVAAQSSNAYGETSGSSVILVTHAEEGVSVGEEIELQVFRTSTPRTPDAPVRPRRGGYPRRFIEAVPVDDPIFLSSPQRLVTFDVVNPAYEDSFAFPLAPDEVRPAPDYAFRDVVHLGRPVYERGPSGRLRVSRPGVRRSIFTRSGTGVGSQVQFFHDVSSINPHEYLELDVLGEQSGTFDPHVAGEQSGASTDTLNLALQESYEVIDLSSIDSQSLESGHTSVLEEEEWLPVIRGRLVISTSGSRARAAPLALDLPLRAPAPVFDADYRDTGIYVDYPKDLGPPSPPLVPPLPGYSNYGGPDFYLHPSLRRRKRRKRRYLSSFVF